MLGSVYPYVYIGVEFTTWRFNLRGHPLIGHVGSSSEEVRLQLNIDSAKSSLVQEIATVPILSLLWAIVNRSSRRQQIFLHSKST